MNATAAKYSTAEDRTFVVTGCRCGNLLRYVQLLPGALFLRFPLSLV
jgi:hypothetical protein